MIFIFGATQREPITFAFPRASSSVLHFFIVLFFIFFIFHFRIKSCTYNNYQEHITLNPWRKDSMVMINRSKFSTDLWWTLAPKFYWVIVSVIDFQFWLCVAIHWLHKSDNPLIYSNVMYKSSQYSTKNSFNTVSISTKVLYFFLVQLFPLELSNYGNNIIDAMAWYRVFNQYGLNQWGFWSCSLIIHLIM